MTKPLTIGAYADCLTILDKTLQVGGLRLPFSRRGTALHFRQRCYRLRKLMLSAAAQSVRPGEIPATRFDVIYVQIEPEGGHVEDPATLVFRLRSADIDIPPATDLEGNPLTIDYTPLPQSELEEDAKALRRSLGLDLE